jgi:hypothetical protein
MYWHTNPWYRFRCLNFSETLTLDHIKSFSSFNHPYQIISAQIFPGVKILNEIFLCPTALGGKIRSVRIKTQFPSNVVCVAVLKSLVLLDFLVFYR